MRRALKVPVVNPTAAIPSYISQLTDAFYEMVPKNLEVLGARIKVQGGVFRWVSSANLLSALTAIDVTAAAGPNEIVVTYEVSFFQSAVFCVAITVFGMAMLIYRGMPWFLMLLWPVVVWGYLYWGASRITEYRLRRFLVRIADRLDPAANPTQISG